MDNRNFFFTVLEAGNENIGCQHDLVLVRTLLPVAEGSLIVLLERRESSVGSSFFEKGETLYFFKSIFRETERENSYKHTPMYQRVRSRVGGRDTEGERESQAASAL